MRIRHTLAPLYDQPSQSRYNTIQTGKKTNTRLTNLSPVTGRRPQRPKNNQSNPLYDHTPTHMRNLRVSPSKKRTNQQRPHRSAKLSPIPQSPSTTSLFPSLTSKLPKLFNPMTIVAVTARNTSVLYRTASVAARTRRKNEMFSLAGVLSNRGAAAPLSTKFFATPTLSLQLIEERPPSKYGMRLTMVPLYMLWGFRISER